MNILVKTGMVSVIPFPGSPGAIQAGCVCSVGENQQGKGVPSNIAGPYGLVFSINDECPLHYIKPLTPNHACENDIERGTGDQADG